MLAMRRSIPLPLALLSLACMLAYLAMGLGASGCAA